MRNLTPQHRSNPPRPPLARLLDRFTPGRLRVRYGPGDDGYAWECSRCARRRDGDGLGAGWTRTLDTARSRAKRHARKHFGMRAVHEED